MARSLELASSLTLLWIVMCVVAAPTAGQEFRVETEVYVGDEEAPASHTVTLFEKSAVYEFMENPDEVVVYRAGTADRPAQFILLDPSTQRRTDVDVDRVEKLIDKLAQWASQQKDAVLQFAGTPKFEESFDAETGSLTLASPQWSYRAVTIEADSAAALERYRDFTDRYAKLSSMLHNAPPPGPRLALNAALARHEVVPVEIHRTTGGDNKNAVRATHLFSWRLSREDRARLDEAQSQLANFTKVGNEQFLAARAERNKPVVRGQSK